MPTVKKSQAIPQVPIARATPPPSPGETLADSAASCSTLHSWRAVGVSPLIQPSSYATRMEKDRVIENAHCPRRRKNQGSDLPRSPKRFRKNTLPTTLDGSGVTSRSPKRLLTRLRAVTTTLPAGTPGLAHKGSSRQSGVRPFFAWNHLRSTMYRSLVCSTFCSRHDCHNF